MRNWLLFLGYLLFLFSCGGGDDGPPPSPEGALLVFPEQDSECTTGVSISETLSQVTFEWQPANNTNRYTLTVINLTTNTPQAISTMSASASLSIEKGAPFSWSVLSSNSASDDTATSESWLFYNAGAQTTYAPFPAQIQFPPAGGTVQANSEGAVELSWIGADVEDDIVTFEVYFSETSPPETLIVSTAPETTQATANVTSATTYFWRVVTTDSEGNTSDSGVFDFKVL
ncbi:MAG: hypothetical protein AAF039_05870 [Bacteroidota bacterium]